MVWLGQLSSRLGVLKLHFALLWQALTKGSIGETLVGVGAGPGLSHAADARVSQQSWLKPQQRHGVRNRLAGSPRTGAHPGNGSNLRRRQHPTPDRRKWNAGNLSLVRGGFDHARRPCLFGLFRVETVTRDKSEEHKPGCAVIYMGMQ